jgi:ADP-heptose:LPS heptosyltransferase
MTSFKNILLVKLRAIGDSVLTLSAMEALRKGFPGARLTVLFPGHSVELLSQDPRADEVLAYPRQALRSLKAHADFFSGLQERHFDLAVCLHASFRTALIGWMSGANARVVRNHSGRDWFSSIRSQEPKEPKSIIERDFDALRALGLKAKPLPPRLELGPAAKIEAAALARRLRLPKGRTVLLFPGAGTPEKRWPRERFIALKAALDKKKIRSAWLLAPGEAWPGDAGAKDILRVPQLLTLAALCAHAGQVIGNDSGPRHIAAAAGARTLTLFGPEALREWHPYALRDGHLALQSGSGKISDLETDAVVQAALGWLR